MFIAYYSAMTEVKTSQQTVVTEGSKAIDSGDQGVVVSPGDMLIATESLDDSRAKKDPAFEEAKKDDGVYEQLTEHGFPRNPLFKSDKILEMAQDGANDLSVIELFAVADKLAKRHPEKAGEIYFEIASSGATNNALHGVRSDLDVTLKDRLNAFMKLVEHDCPQKNRAYTNFRYYYVFTNVEDVVAADAYLTAQGVDTKTNNLVEDALDNIIHVTDEDKSTRGISFDDQIAAILHLETLGHDMSNDRRHVAQNIKDGFLSAPNYRDKMDLVSLHIKTHPDLGDFTPLPREENLLTSSDIYWKRVMTQYGLVEDSTDVKFMVRAIENAGCDPGNFAEEAYLLLVENNELDLDTRMEAYAALNESGSQYAFVANIILGEDIQEELAPLRTAENHNRTSYNQMLTLIRAYRKLNPERDKELSKEMLETSPLLRGATSLSLDPNSPFSKDDPQDLVVREALGLSTETKVADGDGSNSPDNT